ncbi:mCG147777 [Mus musculus]|uniref:Uncharacterized protein n=1 Tax=Mus musculus TaxID=10090 RepID=Q9D7B4_MOUSE|nr:mCG147777 [Mus musculus]BAB26257.1 unnamed protein product [Mus musculus]
MTEETETETIPSLSSTDSNSAPTLEQFLELMRHFTTDPDPNEETVEVSADSFKMTKGGTRIRFLYARREMGLKQLSVVHTSELESREHSFLSQFVRSDGSDSGLRIRLMFPILWHKDWERVTVALGQQVGKPSLGISEDGKQKDLLTWLPGRRQDAGHLWPHPVHLSLWMHI